MSLPSTVVFATGDIDYVAKLNQVIADVNDLNTAFGATQAGALFTGTSTTTITWSAGSRTFTLADATRRGWGVGTPVRVVDTAAPTTKYADGSVTAYAHPSVTIQLGSVNGTSPSQSWSIALTGVAGLVPVASGGTGASDAATARTNLGLGSAATQATSAFATAAQGTKADAALPKAGGTMTGDIDLGDRNLTNVNSLAYAGEVGNTPAAGAVTIDFSTSALQSVTLNGATIAITLTNMRLGYNQLRIIQDATGNRAVTWAAGAGAAYSASRWGGSAAAPALNTAANGESLATFFYNGTSAIQTLFRVGTA